MKTVIKPAHGYAFNLALDRFDTHVLKLFSDPSASRLTRDRVIADVREGKLDHFLLKGIRGLEGLSTDVSDRAAINIIDFHFEPLVLRHFAPARLAAYCKDLEKTLQMETVRGIEHGAALWIDTVHHTCVFSAMPQFAVYLASQYRYRKIILLHQGDRPEPRLGLMGGMVEYACKVRPTFIKLAGNWFSTLAKLTTPDTAIFYLSDMPHEVSKSRVNKEHRDASMQLSAPGISISIGTLSGSDTFARRLNACHVVMDYPRNDRIRVRPYEPGNPVTHCPLEDWAFWPLLKAV